MKKLNPIRPRLNFFKKMMIYFIVITVFILAVSFFSTQFYLYFFERKIEERYEKSLYLSSNVIDTGLLECLKRVESYAWTNEFDSLRKSKNLSKDFPNGFPILGAQIYTYIHSIFFINMQTGTVIDRYSTYKLNDFVKEYYPEIDLDDFYNYVNSMQNNFYKNVNFHENKLTTSLVLPYIINDKGKKDNVILANIDLKKVSFLLSEFNVTPNSNLLLIDAQGNIVTSSDYIVSKYWGFEDLDFFSFLKMNTSKMRTRFKKMMRNKDSIKNYALKKIDDYKILNSIKCGKPLRTKLYNEKRLIISSESVVPYTSRLYYTITIPYRDLYINAIPIDKIAVAISFICLVLSLIFSLIMSKFLYHPVKELLGLIKSSTGLKNTNDEFGVISGKIKELLADRDKLTHNLTMALPMVSENYLFKILNENVIFMEDELKSFLSQNNIVFRHPNFIVSMVRLYFNEEFYYNFNRQKQFDIINETYNLFKNALYKPDDVYILTLNKNEICIIFNLPVEVKITEILESFEKIINIYEYKNEKFIDIFCGFGRLHYGIKGLVESYKESSEAISSLNLFGEDRIRLFEPKSNFDIQYIFDLNEENQLLNYLLTGFKNEAVVLVKSIIEKNQKRNISINMLKELYVRIYYVCVRALNIKDISPVHLMEKDYRDLTKDYINLSLNKISDYVFNMIMKITDMSKNIYSGKFNINNVITFINDNFTEDISLENIASEYNISTPHLSRLLKESLSMSFQKYLNNLRIKKAKYLLNNTSKGIDEISMECGFNSRFTFIRMFKLVEGITPTQFREIKFSNRKN
jgi:AraC-like DNA-binding protein